MRLPGTARCGHLRRESVIGQRATGICAKSVCSDTDGLPNRVLALQRRKGSDVLSQTQLVYSPRLPSFAMSGSVFAARHYLISSTSQMCPTALREIVRMAIRVGAIAVHRDHTTSGWRFASRWAEGRNGKPAGISGAMRARDTGLQPDCSAANCIPSSDSSPKATVGWH